MTIRVSLPSSALVAGVDEVGRGPLAGPVVVAAVVLDPLRPIAGLADSKALTALEREDLARTIMADAQGVSLVSLPPAIIDAVNIRQATFLAMTRAVRALLPAPALVLVDGRDCPPGLPCEGRAVIGGDATEPVISAASIVAKVMRDRMMKALHPLHPHYGFDQHKGYPTAVHRAAIATHGWCNHHRRSFGSFRNETADV